MSILPKSDILDPLEAVLQFAQAHNVILKLRRSDGMIVLDWIENQGVKGAGQTVLRKLMNACDDEDIPITCEIWDANPNLIAFYRRIGFRPYANNRIETWRTTGLDERSPLIVVWASNFQR